MATLNDALNADLAGYEPMDKGGLSGPAPQQDNQPGLNPMIRCPLPPIAANPDSLRQFYQGGRIPQMRLLPPAVSSGASGGGTIIQNTTVVTPATSGSSSSGSSSSPSGGAASSASVTSSVLSFNQQFQGVISISRSFQLIGITATSACRIRLYGTAAVQVQDAGRALDAAPSPGTMQNLISDLVLDTAPYVWGFQNRSGANGDSPQKQLAYVTLTQLGSSSGAITVTLTYAAIEA